MRVNVSLLFSLLFFSRKHLALALHSILQFVGAFYAFYSTVGPCTSAMGLEGCVGWPPFYSEGNTAIQMLSESLEVSE